MSEDCFSKKIYRSVLSLEKVWFQPSQPTTYFYPQQILAHLTPPIRLSNCRQNALLWTIGYKNYTMYIFLFSLLGNILHHS